MLNNKACAIALLNKFETEHTLEIDDQYTKSDFIFYKFKNSNIAVTKRLNHLDFSILSENEWNFLIETVTDQYISHFQYVIEKDSERYYQFINKWNKEESMISKMHAFVNNDVLNNRSLDQLKSKLKMNKGVLDLLLNNKVVLEKNTTGRSRIQESEKVTIEVDLQKSMLGENDRGDISINIIMTASDNNLEMVKNKVLQTVGSGLEEEHKTVNVVDSLISMLILKYNNNPEDESFKSHVSNIYSLSSTNILFNYGIDQFERNYRKFLENAFRYSHRGSLVGLLTDYYYRFNVWSTRSSVHATYPDLEINYRDMTDEHLQLFKTYIEWLINRHARYIGKSEKQFESFILFFSGHELKGKKKTKEDLTRHFDLENMYEEINRRESER